LLKKRKSRPPDVRGGGPAKNSSKETQQHNSTTAESRDGEYRQSHNLLYENTVYCLRPKKSRFPFSGARKQKAAWRIPCGRKGSGADYRPRRAVASLMTASFHGTKPVMLIF